jgi:hypothetical protein
MVLKLIDGTFVPCAGLWEIRAGDLFRIVPGPLLCATADAVQRPSAARPERLAWVVDAEAAGRVPDSSARH